MAWFSERASQRGLAHGSRRALVVPTRAVQVTPFTHRILHHFAERCKRWFSKCIQDAGFRATAARIRYSSTLGRHVRQALARAPRCERRVICSALCWAPPATRRDQGNGGSAAVRPRTIRALQHAEPNGSA